MPVFDYIALSKSGRKKRGTILASSEQDARKELRASGTHVLSMRASSANSGRPSPEAVRTTDSRRVKPRDLAAATRHLATLLTAGMPLVPALGALVEQLSGQRLVKIIADIRDKVSEGMTLAAALERHPKVFSQLYVNMASAGEATGSLEKVLVRLADMSEKRINLANKVRGALAYPLFMLVVGAGVIMFLLSFVIPSIAKLFLEMNRELPWPTMALIKVSSFLQDYLWAIVLAICAVVLGSGLWVRTVAGRLAWDQMKLRVPLLGDLVRKAAVSRFAHTLGGLLASGVLILEALDITKRVVGNAVLANALSAVRDCVGHGDSIANSLRRSGVFPPIVFHAIAVGEANGNVAEGLLNVANAYDSEIEFTVGAITSLLEPIMILVLGVLVGLIVLAILLPIFEINQAIQ